MAKVYLPVYAELPEGTGGDFKMPRWKVGEETPLYEIAPNGKMWWGKVVEFAATAAMAGASETLIPHGIIGSDAQYIEIDKAQGIGKTTYPGRSFPVPFYHPRSTTSSMSVFLDEAGNVRVQAGTDFTNLYEKFRVYIRFTRASDAPIPEE